MFIISLLCSSVQSIISKESFIGLCGQGHTSVLNLVVVKDSRMTDSPGIMSCSDAKEMKSGGLSGAEQTYSMKFNNGTSIVAGNKPEGQTFG